MKRTISMILAILMLLPIIASMVVAVSPDDVVISDKPTNVASLGEVSESKGLYWTNWYGDTLIDGDKENGTYSPKGRDVSIKLSFEQEYYISSLVLVVNGKGSASGDSFDEVVYDTASVKVKGYDKKGALVYESEIMNTTAVTDATFTPNADVKVIEFEITHVEDGASAYSSLWEIEAYATTPPVRCEAEHTNIASEALLNSTYYDSKEEKHVTSSWWAMDLPRMVDGDIHTGTHTVKSSVFSLWFYFGQERLMSEVVVHTNGYGSLSPATGLKTEDFKDSTGAVLGKEVNYFNSYEITVVLYDFNDEVVYESELVDVSTMTEFVAQAGVSAATVELKISNAGSAGQGGGVYIWDVEIKEEKGDHIYELEKQENPQCGFPGYKQYRCMDPSCDMIKMESIPATGYHTWNEGVISNDPTETTIGTKLFTCIDCGAELKRDVPAIGNHTWAKGETIPSSCDDGYTVYKCTDADCELTYKADFVSGLGHKYDEGVVTERATIDKEGKITFTCQREGCGYKHEKELRKAKYIDNTFKVDNSIVKEFIGSAHQDLAANVFDGIIDDKFWCAPGKYTETKVDGETVQTRNSGTLEIILDNEYYFTKGVIYVASNWNWMEVHFMYKDEQGVWQTSATYSHDRIQSDNVSGLDMTSDLNQGARASKIVIETVGSIGGGDNSVKTHWLIPEYPGSGLRFYELQLEAHKCNLTPNDYEAKENWKMPTCSKAGSCKATCPVCGTTSTVILDSETYAHSYGDVSVIDEPTCSESGVGEKTCTECSYTATVAIPATGEHDYSKDSVFIDSDCSRVGVGRKVCADCGDIEYQYEIPATGVHKYVYKVKAQSNYTAIGREVHVCEYCDKQGELEDIIHEKLEIPEELITFQGYSIRMTNYVGIRASFKFDKDALEELQKTCDVTITILAKNLSTGKVVSAEAYGKTLYYSNGFKHNENNEFSAVAKVTDCNSEYEFSYQIKLVNLRGTEIKTVVVPGYTSGKTTTTVKEIAKDAIKASTIKADVKKLYEEIIAE